MDRLARLRKQRSKPSQNTQTPATASNGKSELTSEIPFTDADEQSIREQVEQNWNLGSLSGSSELAGLVVQLRVELLPDGTVTKVDIENDQSGSSTFRQVADSAMRAVMQSSPLKLPPGASFSVMHLRFHPDQIIQ
jgi:TonB C terminal